MWLHAPGRGKTEGTGQPLGVGRANLSSPFLLPTKVSVDERETHTSRRTRNQNKMYVRELCLPERGRRQLAR